MSTKHQSNGKYKPRKRRDSRAARKPGAANMTTITMATVQIEREMLSSPWQLYVYIWNKRGENDHDNFTDKERKKFVTMTTVGLQTDKKGNDHHGNGTADNPHSN